MQTVCIWIRIATEGGIGQTKEYREYERGVGEARKSNEADGGNRFNTRWQSTAACGAAERRADGSNQFDAFFKDTTNPGSVNFSPKLQQPLLYPLTDSLAILLSLWVHTFF